MKTTYLTDNKVGCLISFSGQPCLNRQIQYCQIARCSQFYLTLFHESVAYFTNNL